MPAPSAQALVCLVVLTLSRSTGLLNEKSSSRKSRQRKPPACSKAPDGLPSDGEWSHLLFFQGTLCVESGEKRLGRTPKCQNLLESLFNSSRPGLGGPPRFLIL